MMFFCFFFEEVEKEEKRRGVDARSALAVADYELAPLLSSPSMSACSAFSPARLRSEKSAL